MAVVTLVGTKTTDLVATKQTFVDSRYHYGRVRCTFDSVETNNDDSIGSTYHLARLPSNAVILPSSTLYWDNIGASGATADVGVYAVDSNLANADDPNGLLDGVSVATASSNSLLEDFASGQTALWDYVASESSDPGGLLDIKVILQDAVTDAIGSISLEIFYTVD